VLRQSHSREWLFCRFATAVAQAQQLAVYFIIGGGDFFRSHKKGFSRFFSESQA
jgi:hypothetical protein